MHVEYHWVEVWPIITSTIHFIATHLQDLELRDGFDSLVTSVTRWHDGIEFKRY